MVILPATQNEWLNLRSQDYRIVSEYNSALFNIVSRLRLCGEKVSEEQMLEKTLSTFHGSNVLLQEQPTGSSQFLKQMPALAQTRAKVGGMEDRNSPVEVAEITPPSEVVLKVLHQHSKITRSGLPLNTRTTKIHRLTLLTVLMIHATDVEEVGIGHALAVHQRKWWNNTKYIRPLII
ncbi:hypothetical protein MRB53_030305 [Persea americana]|uniref:Uncharacterized protein n=1 Tax=Persea americana TaxID=3435 RepID=A0ACC2KKX3_PERAE|nr:hypothetical protein MRB53_030305 [Persea americana]